MQPAAYINISDTSPSIGPCNEIIYCPDSRDSLQVETDERRWFDRQLHRRIDKAIIELGVTTDYLYLVSEKVDLLSRDLARERAARLESESNLRQLITNHGIEMAAIQDAAARRFEVYAQEMAELGRQIDKLKERTWWSMLKESVRSLWKR